MWQRDYNIFKAFLMMSSRESPGSFLTMAATVFSTAFLVNPSIIRAEHASEVFAPAEPPVRSSSAPPFEILSLSSMMTFWAVLSPMPFTPLMRLTSPDMTAVETSSAVSDERTHPGGIGTYAGNSDKQNENPPFLLVTEPVERLFIFADMVIYVDFDLLLALEPVVGVERYLEPESYAVAFHYRLRGRKLLQSTFYIFVHGVFF